MACALTQPLAIAEAVKMSQSGTPPEEVIQRIRSSRTTYALRGSDFGKLKGVGVSVGGSRRDLRIGLTDLGYVRFGSTRRVGGLDPAKGRSRDFSKPVF